MYEHKKEEAAKHIQEELCNAAFNIAFEVKVMLDAYEDTVIDRVIETIDRWNTDKHIEHTDEWNDAIELIRRVAALKGGQK